MSEIRLTEEWLRSIEAGEAILKVHPNDIHAIEKRALTAEVRRLQAKIAALRRANPSHQPKEQTQ